MNVERLRRSGRLRAAPTGAVEITGVYRSTHYTENFHYKIAMAHRPASSPRLMQ